MGLSRSRLFPSETTASSLATPQPHHPPRTLFSLTLQSQSFAALPVQTKQLHQTWPVVSLVPCPPYRQQQKQPPVI
ncbi:MULTISPECIES: hypothetical protein [Nostoc]|uniref:Uncharacterized protein n=1 Tax=Nostoc paludosum FACHB-159 TaxID=2692908 RepID=A0ABR8KK51_9NOSO|nr:MULTISPECIES: hypothetical protein [Nostoc]MBD2683622.1 hypothetical protein [Nostoc sp. FACHB-857]MBD2739952.1 hypothetical protein [Nostoc paludosum FACHB-159]